MSLTNANVKKVGLGSCVMSQTVPRVAETGGALMLKCVNATLPIIVLT